MCLNPPMVENVITKYSHYSLTFLFFFHLFIDWGHKITSSHWTMSGCEMCHFQVKAVESQ